MMAAINEISPPPSEPFEPICARCGNSDICLHTDGVAWDATTHTWQFFPSGSTTSIHCAACGPIDQINWAPVYNQSSTPPMFAGG